MLTFEKLQRSRIHQSDPAPHDTLDELETIISIEQFCGSCSHPVVQLRTFRHGLVSLPNDTFFLMEVETDTKVLIKGEWFDPDAVFENVTKRVWMTKSEIVDTGLWDVNEFERQLKNYRRSESESTDQEVAEYARYFQNKKQRLDESQPPRAGPSNEEGSLALE